ncbi:hypothetical protein RCL1_009167 [Eukaryota sp. TZLM3-RCL]
MSVISLHPHSGFQRPSSINLFHHQYPHRDSSSPLRRLTTDITACYSKCNPHFNYSTACNPRRILTKPSQPAGNNGHDNVNSDLIIHVHDIFGSGHHAYQVVQMLGQGTFGQVVQCVRISDRKQFAVKVIKNKPAYYKQALMEVRILQHLLTEDNNDSFHLIRMVEHFSHLNHLCIVFELLSVNLYELIKQNNFKGLSITFIRVLLRQLLVAMSVLDKCKIIHCDLKPENILLVDSTTPAIKVIDFGSSCYEEQTAYSYIQSRFYRAPEVILGLQYNACIDVWSLGCIAAELFLGLPLFPGVSQYSQLSRIIEMIGIPPDYMISRSKHATSFFHFDPSIGPSTGGVKHKIVTRRGLTYEYDAKRPLSQPSSYQFKSEQVYYAEQRGPIPQSKRYFKFRYLPDIIHNYPMPPNSTVSEQSIKFERSVLISFLEECLIIDPLQRISVRQALSHPFILDIPLSPERTDLLNFRRPVDSHHDERLSKLRTKLGVAHLVEERSIEEDNEVRRRKTDVKNKRSGNYE